MRSPPWLAPDMAMLEDVLLDSASSNDPLVGEAATHLLRAGGKRLRPALVLITARAGSNKGHESILAAAALELVHLATLYHDDVIDAADTRRGVPTVHAKWGTEVAVLAGDYLFARGCSLGAAAGGRVPSILAAAIASVCEGQLIETETVGDPTRSPADYLATIEKKTAALFAAACELGCATSAASPPTTEKLTDFGKNLGMAFQIVDDILDVVGDIAVIGKPPGADLRAGVFTLPLLLAAQGDETFASLLTSGERDLEVLRAMLQTNGGVDEALEVARTYARDASEALSDLPATEWTAELESIAGDVVRQAELVR